MNGYYILLVGAVIGIAVFLFVSFSKSKNKECFTAENFDKTIDYTRWKQKTSKIGKVLVNDYRVEVSNENELLFKHDKDQYTIFKVNREKGIILLPVKQTERLKAKANNAFCELLERALF